MVRGEGPGWHRESRRHSEAAKRSRPTHAPRTGDRSPIEVTLSTRERRALDVLERNHVRGRVMETSLHGGSLEVQLFEDDVPGELWAKIRKEITEGDKGTITWSEQDPEFWDDVHFDPINRHMTTSGKRTRRR